MSSTNDTLGEKAAGVVNESGPESAEQEVRSADLAEASVLKSGGAAEPEKLPEASVGGELLVSVVTLCGDPFPGVWFDLLKFESFC